MKNFYINANISGRKTPLTGGTKNKNDTISLDFSANNQGSSETIVRIYGYPKKNGELGVDVWLKGYLEPVEFTLNKRS